MSRRRFVLLDRDGTIIVEKHYLSDPDDVELLEGSALGMRKLAELGLGLVVVTNQSAVGRGIVDLDGLDAIHRRMEQKLEAEGIRLDSIHYCPHHPDDDCQCRKPRTGMVEQAAAKHGFEPSQCFVIGDMASDVGLGRALGATTLLARTGHGSATEASGAVSPDHVVEDLREAASVIEGLVTKSG